MFPCAVCQQEEGVYLEACLVALEQRTSVFGLEKLGRMLLFQIKSVLLISIKGTCVVLEKSACVVVFGDQDAYCRVCVQRVFDVFQEGENCFIVLKKEGVVCRVIESRCDLLCCVK
jgi:hypothetical protein